MGRTDLLQRLEELAFGLQRLEELASGWRAWLTVGDDPEAAYELARIETALAWADAGSFGQCDQCSAELTAAQVEHNPADITCPGCQPLLAVTQVA